MYEGLKLQLDESIGITSQEFDTFLSFVQTKRFKKKELVLKEGEICKNAYFVKEGCLRYYYNLDGMEQTGQFFFENSWYTDYDSFLHTTPSKINIQALEPSELIILSKASMEKLYIAIPKFERFTRMMTERAFLGIRQKNEMLINLNPEARYLDFMQKRPKVMERVPQHYIASYLGMKPQSLSRIRKRIAGKA